ncbi:MAG: DUF2306 domain-containing protein [Pseudomonadota bacterium]
MANAFTPAIWIHLGAALAALVLGGFLFLARKGTPAHRIAGRTWAALMLVTALSTWWIRGSGAFSWLHLFSIAALAGLAAAVYFAFTHQIERHRRAVTGLYVGALVIAGAFAFLPQRLLGRALWAALGAA